MPAAAGIDRTADRAPPAAPDRMDTPRPDPRSVYASPLPGRYASQAMAALWSEKTKFEGWRRVWLALAQAQHELGLPVSAAQVEAIRRCQTVTDADFARAREHEQRTRHDVMAHVHALGDVAPEARGIIHLGATSQDIVCNAEIPQIKTSLDLVCVKTARLIDAIARFAERHKATPCLGWTHLQPAQPTTVGKRAAMWGSDVALCLSRLEFTRDHLPLRGIKGATGTQASFLALFDGDAAKVEALEKRVIELLGAPGRAALAATGQTYPRVTDAHVIGEVAALAAALHKIALDIRLLSSRKELDEPMEAGQVGSSAMPHKRNPMRCERACGLARFVMSLTNAALETAADQGLERTLDDSVARRLFLPEAFLSIDGALELMIEVAAGLTVNEGAVRRNLEDELPFLVLEDLMLAAARKGRDRQKVHEALRRHALEASRVVKEQGKSSDLLDRLSREPALEGIDIRAAVSPARLIGLAPRQVDRFIAEIASPIRKRYAAEGREARGDRPLV